MLKLPGIANNYISHENFFFGGDAKEIKVFKLSTLSVCVVAKWVLC